MAAYTRPATDEQLLAALEEIGSNGEGLDLTGLDLDFGDGDGSTGRTSMEAEEIPEVDSPLDEEG